jgi:hypothetical protein
MALSKNRVPEGRMHPQKGFGRQKTYKVTVLQNPALTFLLFSSLSATGTMYQAEVKWDPMILAQGRK